jgi:predicted phage terminase large subunit-like protein
LYGGAAGGGKSSALLMAALQFVSVPGYSAILFRRTYSDLALPGALMSRASEWLSGSGATWNDTTKTWRFPSGATLTFGYLDTANDRFRYQSSEFSFIGFDELTTFNEVDYLYLFSRLRRLATSQVPLRMRAATNPGGIGHAWVKRRFLSSEAAHNGRVFVSAKLADNPHLDQSEYTKALINLDPFTRNQLLHGDWSEFSGNHFYPSEWPRFGHNGDAFILEPRRIVLERDVWNFLVVDPATEAKKSADFTCIMVLGVMDDGQLLILDVVRQQMDVGQIVPTLSDVCQRWRPAFVGMESIAFQKLLIAEASKHRLIPSIQELKPAGRGKLSRAVAAIVKAERCEIHVPQDAPWLDDLMTELASFTGHGDPHDDQVDCLAYAVLAAQGFSPDYWDEPILGTPGKTEW